MRRAVPVIALAALFALLLLPAGGSPQTARADGTWDVIVGGDAAPNITTYAFWPAAITIHTGDTVRWSFFSQVEHHTVSFLRDDPPRPLYLPGPGAGELTLGPAWFPAGSIVGNGTFDNSRSLSSGAVFGGDPPLYALTFTTAGVFSYLCQLHPGMQGSVAVLDGDQALGETPEQAIARGQSAFDARVAALRAAAAAQPDVTPLAGPVTGGAPGAAVYPLNLGLSDPGGATLLQPLPAAVTVRRGDTLLWTNTDVYGTHTVAFADGGPLPDAPSVRGSGPPMLVLPANVAGPAGGGVLNGAGYVNSGLLQPGATFALTVDAPPGDYRYVCLLHREVMRGTITVLDAGGQ